MLEGEFTVQIEDQKIELNTGETVMIPTDHGFAAIEHEPARGLVVAAPSTFGTLPPAATEMCHWETLKIHSET